MNKLPLRLLLNAEPFGFGPAAAIAGLFPHLRPTFETIGYLGKKHTLDLQRKLPYDAIHDVTGTPKAERDATYASIFANYDILLTAMDHKIAENAQKAGLQVYYYDALAWYWKNIPDSVKKCDLYIAQNFFGVRERLDTEFAHHGAAYTVPLITPLPLPQEKEHILINLGGLQNPYWPLDEVSAYAKAIVKTLLKTIPSTEKVVIAASQSIAEQMKETGAQTYSQEEMQNILAKSKAAFMTPGLGNIYDSAAHNLPTVWLPPANDSQGQQLDLIKKQGMIDADLDWREIFPHAEICYNMDQRVVLGAIAQAAKLLSCDEKALDRLEKLASRHLTFLKDQKTGKTAGLVRLFGSGGFENAANLISEQAQRALSSDYFFTFTNALTVKLSSPVDVHHDKNFRLQMGAYVPGLNIASQPERPTDICITHTFSNAPRLDIKSCANVSVFTPYQEKFPDDLYHLSYGLVRKAVFERGLAIVHAACLGKNGRFLLIGGHSGAGKTTIAQKMVREHGYKLFSGNKTVLRFDESKGMVAVAGTSTVTALNEKMQRLAYELPASCYETAPEVAVTDIILVRINEGVSEEQVLTQPSALHTLFPYFTDSVNADVIVNGRDLFDGTISAQARQKLIHNMAHILESVPVRKASGSPDFLVTTCCKQGIKP